MVLITHLTSPSSSIFWRVSTVRGVDASTQTPPSFNLMAVDRPPIGTIPIRVKGLLTWNINNGRHRVSSTNSLPGEDPNVFRNLEQLDKDDVSHYDVDNKPLE